MPEENFFLIIFLIIIFKSVLYIESLLQQSLLREGEVSFSSCFFFLNIEVLTVYERLPAGCSNHYTLDLFKTVVHRYLSCISRWTSFFAFSHSHTKPHINTLLWVARGPCIKYKKMKYNLPSFHLSPYLFLCCKNLENIDLLFKRLLKSVHNVRGNNSII